MANREGSSGNSALLAFALGALAGAAVALLYAPASGADTRRALRRKVRAGRDRVKDLADDGRDYVERQRDNVVEAMEHGREVFDKVRREPLTRDGKESV